MTNPVLHRTQGELQVAYAYCLSHLAHLGERSALKLKKVFPTYESWVALPFSEREEAARKAVGRDSVGVVTSNFDALLERSVSDVQKHERAGIHVLSIDNEEYPELLKQIPDPPLVLFVKGSIRPLTENSNVAVVGTRDSTNTGEKVAAKIARWLSERDWCVISGLAKGIDAAAHRGTLDVRGRTAAVMATPLNKVYPAENKELANEILDNGGCWISELPLWGKFHRSSFVQRDRIQSGLSVAVIPVQTDCEGGTMHTVRYAEQQGRLLLCPRPIEAEQSLKQYAGVRQLIESGRAVPFSSSELTTVLQSLQDYRNKLLKNVTTEAKVEITPTDYSQQPAVSLSDIAASTEEQPSDQHDVKSEVEEVKTKRKRRSRLQAGFDFIQEPAPTKVMRKGKRAREVQIRLLEELRDEIDDPQPTGRAAISNLGDFKVWLDEKIKMLRNQSGDQSVG